MNLFAKVASQTVSTALLAPLQTIQYARYVEGDATPFHSASYHHAILTSSGEAVFQERGKEEFVCRPGTFFAIPAGVVYRWRIRRPTALLQCLHKPFGFVEHRGLANLFGAGSAGLFHLDLEKRVFERFASNLKQDAGEEEPMRGLLLSTSWLRLLALVTARFNAGDRAKHPALVKAIRHLVENPHREVPLEEIALVSGLSVSRLSQLFRENVGMAPLRYHAMLKAERATELILEGSLRIEAIAERLGFASGSAFRRFYKRTTGVTPGRAVHRQSGL